MSAIACCWQTGRLQVVAMFGSDPDLEARSLRDGVGELYQAARLSGELLISGRRIPDIAALFAEAATRFGGRPDAIVCATVGAYPNCGTNWTPTPLGKIYR